MNMNDLRELAQQHYVFDAGLSKTETIRAIQAAEGNFDCYARADSGECDQSLCRWRDDCLADSTRTEVAIPDAVAAKRKVHSRRSARAD